MTVNVSNGGFGTAGAYARIASGLAALVGSRCVATARIRIPAGTSFRGVGLIAHFSTSSYKVCDPSAANENSPIDAFDAIIYSDPFTIPENATQLWIYVSPSQGTGIVDFRQAGILQIAGP